MPIGVTDSQLVHGKGIGVHLFIPGISCGHPASVFAPGHPPGNRTAPQSCKHCRKYYLHIAQRKRKSKISFPKDIQLRENKGRKTEFSTVLPQLCFRFGSCSAPVRRPRCNESNLKTARKTSGLSTGELAHRFPPDFPTALGQRGN